MWSKERMEEAIANDNVEFSLQKDGSYTVRSKSYLYDENGKIRRGKPVSVMNGPFTQDGTQEVRNLFDAKSVFDFTKPSELIKFFIGLEINGNNSRDYIISLIPQHFDLTLFISSEQQKVAQDFACQIFHFILVLQIKTSVNRKQDMAKVQIKSEKHTQPFGGIFSNSWSNFDIHSFQPYYST